MPPPRATGYGCVCTVRHEAEGQSKSQRGKLFSDVSWAPFAAAERQSRGSMRFHCTEAPGTNPWLTPVSWGIEDPLPQSARGCSERVQGWRLSILQQFGYIIDATFQKAERFAKLLTTAGQMYLHDRIYKHHLYFLRYFPLSWWPLHLAVLCMHNLFK